MVLSYRERIEDEADWLRGRSVTLREEEERGEVERFSFSCSRAYRKVGMIGTRRDRSR